MTWLDDLPAQATVRREGWCSYSITVARRGGGEYVRSWWALTRRGADRKARRLLRREIATERRRADITTITEGDL